MTSKLVHVKDADKGSDIYFDPQGLEGAVFNWNGQKDYSQYIYNAMCICEAVV